MIKFNNSFGAFPKTRLRRNRYSSWVRELVAENHLTASNLIMPFFVIDGKNQSQKTSIDGIERFSIDLLIEQAKRAADLGIGAIMLFPVIDERIKTHDGGEAYNKNNLICNAVAALKKAVPDLGVICDVALDPYTTHGHDGLLSKDKNYVLNDQTIEILSRQALILAGAGCDFVAPSDMMDGRVGEIRKKLDENDYKDIGIISYAAKYASNFYRPFRDVVGSAKNLGSADKKNYQMDFRNSREALREVALDVIEGADMIIIKPALPYLDIIHKVKENFPLPILAYQVSGEYAMLKIAAQHGVLDFMPCLFETLFACQRAGATAIISYGAMDVAKEIRNGFVAQL